MSISQEQKAMAEKVMKIYSAFGIKIEGLLNVSAGPAGTRYEFEISPHIKPVKITRLRDDVSLMLSVPRVQIECPLPGKSAFSIEIRDPS